jgi:hypothetical protein
MEAVYVAVGRHGIKHGHRVNVRRQRQLHEDSVGMPVLLSGYRLHDFTGAALGSGDHTIPAGESLTIRYLFVFHEGDSEAAGIEGRWKRWAASGAAAAADGAKAAP